MNKVLRIGFGVLVALSFGGVIIPLAHGEPAQVLHMGNESEPKDLDPHVVTGVAEGHILDNLFEPLVVQDPNTLKPLPGVAESWKTSKDGKTWTFTLRKNAKWSNGDPVTAEDFAFAWTRLLNPATAAQYAHSAFILKNAQDYNSGKIKDAAQVGVKAVGPYTLEVKLENPTPYLLTAVAHYTFFPVHKASITKLGGAWTRPGNMISNGPWQLNNWETNKVIKLTQNPHYWDKAKVKLTELYFYPTENMDAEEKMFRTKQLQVTYQVPLEKLPYWREDKSGVLRSHPYYGTYFYRLNTTKPGLSDKRVRKALALAIDRDRLIQYVTKGGEEALLAFTPEGAGYKPKKYWASNGSNIEEAKKLLAEAGYPGGKGFPTLEILYNTQEGHRKIAEAVHQMWKDNLGISSVKLLNQEWKVYLNNMRTMNYDLARSGWIGDYVDPNTFADLWVTGGGHNNTGWSNKTYDKLLEAASKEMDVKKRMALFTKMEDILADEMPVIPIYIWRKNQLIATDVADFPENVQDRWWLKGVSRK